MRTLVVTVPAADAEVAADRLWSCGARAVEERSCRDDLVELHTVLAGDDDVSRSRFGDVPDTWRLEFVEVDDEPAQTWRDHARPVAVGPHLVVHPAWLPVDIDPAVTRITIEPGASFGLGDHPTTRLTAAAVERLVRPGDRVLDVGCGSGVLAVIAAVRGASHVEAIDIADAAREATDDNADRNGVGSLVHASTTALVDVDGRYDLVLANILAPTLVSMSVDLRRVTAPGGALVISGILFDHHQHVLDALAPMRAVETHELHGWVAVELRHT